jgi:hypothetical protein
LLGAVHAAKLHEHTILLWREIAPKTAETPMATEASEAAEAADSVIITRGAITSIVAGRERIAPKASEASDRIVTVD